MSETEESKAIKIVKRKSNIVCMKSERRLWFNDRGVVPEDFRIFRIMPCTR